MLSLKKEKKSDFYQNEIIADIQNMITSKYSEYDVTLVKNISDSGVIKLHFKVGNKELLMMSINKYSEHS